MLRVLNNNQFSTNRHPEDIFYTILNKHKLYMAPYEVAKTFSVEQQFYNKPYGVHKPWWYHEKDKLNILKKHCPLLNDIDSRWGGGT